MMKFKRICAILLALTLSLCCGCGESDGSKKTGKKPVGNSLNDPYFDSIPVELEGTTVKFATWINHRANESADVLDDFTNLTGIDVELVTITQSDYISKLASLISAGQSPDVVVNNGEFPNILNVLTPLDDTILDTTDSFWNQEIVKLGTIGGRPYFVNSVDSPWDMICTPKVRRFWRCIFFMGKTGRKNKVYSAEFKISVIMDMREHKLGYNETIRKYWNDGLVLNHFQQIKLWEQKNPRLTFNREPRIF